MEFLGSVPEELRDSVERWWERARAQAGFEDRYRALGSADRAQLPRVVAASEFVAQALIQDPAALAPGGANTHYEEQVAAAQTGEQASFLLREWRRREMVRIAWRDIAGTAAVGETLQSVSDLADATIRAAVASAERQLLPIFGEPQRSNPALSPFIVLGMGKLGVFLGCFLVGSSRVDLQACKLEYSIVSPK